MTTVPITTQERVPMPIHVGARPSHAGGAAMSLADVIRVLKQRIFMIAFIFIFFVGTAVGLTFWLANNHPLYSSFAAVLVESPFPQNPMEFAEPMLQGDLLNRFVADQMFMVKDESLLRDALADPEVMETSWYQQEPSKNRLLQELKADLDVRQMPNSSIFTVTFSTRAVGDAPKIVNVIVRRYVSRVQRLSRDRYSAELDKFISQEDDIKRELKTVQDDKEAFLTSQLDAPGLISDINVTGEVWRSLAMEAATIEAQALQLKAAFENLKGLDASEITLSPQMMLLIDQDPQIAGLKNTLIELRQSQLAILQKVGPNHTATLQIKSQMDAVQALLDDTLAQRREQARQYQMGSAETAYLNALQAQIELQERVNKAKAEQRDADRKLARYTRLEEDERRLREELSQISERINSLRLITRRDQEVVRVHVVSSAVQALEPSFPSWRVNISVGTILGLAVGIGLAILLEIIDTSIKTTRDVVRHVHVPILGTVPDLDDEELPIDQVELAMHTAPRSMIAEAFRAIRTNLSLSSPAERQRSLLVTSAKPEEGKTAVAINLAIAVAQNNKRVLLVDANFHRPTLRNFFPKARPEGLSNMLIGQGRLADLVSRTDLPNLDLLSSGPIPPNPAELLASGYMRELLREAVNVYDQVIFDGPPTLLMSDALVLAGALDGVVLVCRAKAVSRGVVLRAREQLERANVRIFGAVLNAAQITRGGYFREQIRTYYDYQPADALKATSRAALPDYQTPKGGDGGGKETDAS